MEIIDAPFMRTKTLKGSKNATCTSQIICKTKKHAKIYDYLTEAIAKQAGKMVKEQVEKNGSDSNFNIDAITQEARLQIEKIHPVHKFKAKFSDDMKKAIASKYSSSAKVSQLVIEHRHSNKCICKI